MLSSAASLEVDDRGVISWGIDGARSRSPFTRLDMGGRWRTHVSFRLVQLPQGYASSHYSKGVSENRPPTVLFPS